MNGLTARQKYRYWFDNTLASGTKAMILWLTLATIALILIVSFIAALIDVQANGASLGFGEALWQNLLRTMDPGTMGGDEGWTFRILSLIATIGGILVVSSLIGLLANGISDRVAELRRGHSAVLETGHTLILGWSPKIFPIISELVVANENQAHSSLVVLAPLEKDEMDRQIAARIPDTGKTRIICRTGTPFEPIDIAIARPDAAKAVVVLNPGHADGDAEVVKTALAVLRSTELTSGIPVITEIGDVFTAKALRDGTKGAVTVVRSTSIIARVTAQVCRQPGLSDVYQDLFDFDGDEIYFHSVPELAGSSFGEALLSFDESVPLGIKFGDGRIVLNPAMDTVLTADDQLIAIAEDDDKIVFTGKGTVAKVSPVTLPATVAAERTVLIGWNHMAAEIIRELDSYATPGSELAIQIDPDVMTARETNLPDGLANLRVSMSDAALDPESLRRMMQEEPPDHVIVLCYKERLSEAQADARVLLTLLHLRAAIDAAGVETNIVAELLDERDVGLTPSRHSDEFIVSERLSALLMAQLSENRDLSPVFEDLLDEEGSEIYLKPSALYFADAKAVSFADVVDAARARREIAIGYQISKAESGRNVVINPPKSETVDLAGDAQIIVLSEEQD
jgi:hypothetical protein